MESNNEQEYADPNWFNNYGVECYWEDDEEPEVDEEPEEPEDIRPQTPPEEKKDRFFLICKTGEFFKIDTRNLFYYLRDGQWVYCPPLMTFYFDAASDYYEINYDPAFEFPGGKRPG